MTLSLSHSSETDLHDLHLQVLVKGGRHLDSIQHLIQQLLLGNLCIRGNKAVLTKDLQPQRGGGRKGDAEMEIEISEELKNSDRGIID